MKKLSKIIATGLIYAFFLFSFSIFDSIRLVGGILSKLGIINTTVETKGTVSLMSDPMPEPPVPVPPPKN